MVAVWPATKIEASMQRFEFKLTVVAFFCALLFSVGPVSAAASLNFYWINGFGSWFGRAPIEIDGTKVGTLKAGGQLRVDALPGAHQVRIHLPLSFERVKLMVNVPQGGEQFLKFSRDMDGMFFNAIGPVPLFTLNLRLVPRATALADINGKRLNPPSPPPSPGAKVRTKKKNPNN